MLWKRSKREDALPASDRVRPDDRVHSRQMLAYILRRASWPLMYNHMLRVCFGSLQKAITDECRSQTLEKLLVRLREAVIKLITGCPQRIATGAWQHGQSQGGVIGWLGLELDVRVPLRAVVTVFVGLSLMPEHLLPGDGADGGDLGIADTELGGIVQHWVDVKG